MAYNGKTAYDIVEKDVRIEDKDWDDEEVQTLWARHILAYDKMAEFWTPSIERGRQIFDYEKGRIFTDKQRAYYMDKEDKFPIEPRLMESRIYTLIGEVIKGRKSGSITTEGGSLDNPTESATLVSIANVLMKDMEKHFKERRHIKDLLHDALVACYPVWLWTEKETPGMNRSHKATLLPWDSVLVAPFHFRYPEEISHVCMKTPMKESELIKKYPEMKFQIKAHSDKLKSKDNEELSSIGELETGITSQDRSKITSIASDGRFNVAMPNGYYEVITRVFRIFSEEEVLINLASPTQFYIRPPDWEDERWGALQEEKMAEEYSDYVLDTREVCVLWQTVGTTSGLMLENKKHWFQKDGMMPGCPFWPATIDGDITGPGEKMMANILKAACAETEFLDEVRKGSGNLWLLRSGYIQNLSNFHEEVSRNNGVVFINKTWNGNLADVAQNIQRKPNNSTYEYAQKARMDLDDETRINASMQGGSNPNQAAIAKTTEIAQGLIAQSDYIENFNLWWENFQNLKCALIPYIYNSYEVVEILDESTGQPVSVEVNSPQVGISGDVESVVNDICSVEYKFRIAATDDSPTAKDLERQQALIFLNSVPGPMAAIDPSGELLAAFMAAMPNKILNQVGKRLLAKAQERNQMQQQQAQTQQMLEANERLMKLKNEAEKIKASKISLSLTGDQLAQFPELTGLLSAVGYFDMPQQQIEAEQAVSGANMQAQEQMQTEQVQTMPENNANQNTGI